MIGQNKENVTYLKEKYSLWGIKVKENSSRESLDIGFAFEERKSICD
jgi:hypothetical protein